MLLGDYLYAHGLVRIAELGEIAVVTELAELLSLCAQLRADAGGLADGLAWAGTVAVLGKGDGRARAARTALRDRHDPDPLAALATATAGEEAVHRVLTLHADRTD